MIYLLMLGSCSLTFAFGWFMASAMFTNGLADDIRELDAERQALDEEREMLTRFWAMDVQPPVIEDLGAHKRIDRVLS